MRKKTIFVLAIALMMGLYSINTSAQEVEEINSRIPAKIHVIQNFEDWNDVMIRFTGVLKNSCYTKNETHIRVLDNQILIQNLVRYSGVPNCIMMITPYSDQVAVRNLKKGAYDVFVMDRSGIYQEMTSFITE
jgi:hypothetical protein